MANWVKIFLQMLLFAAVILIVYNALKHFVLSKIKVNKWVVFVLGLISLFVPNILAAAFSINPQQSLIWVYGPSSLFMIFFLWFMDLSGLNRMGKASKKGNMTITTTFERKKNKKDVVIRPKAKPNRVKNKND